MMLEKKFLKNNVNYIEIFDFTLDNLKKNLRIVMVLELEQPNFLRKFWHIELKIVARHGVGYDSVDIEFLNEKRIPLAITGSSNAVSVAEHVITMFLALSRRIIDCHNLVKNGEYLQKTMIQKTVEIFNKKVLIIGFGRIGRSC